MDKTTTSTADHNLFKVVESTVVYEIGIFKVSFKCYGGKLDQADLYKAQYEITKMDGAPIASIKRRIREKLGVNVNITLNRFFLPIN